LEKKKKVKISREEGRKGEGILILKAKTRVYKRRPSRVRKKKWRRRGNHTGKKRGAAKYEEKRSIL